jgi:hypothetical protein
MSYSVQTSKSELSAMMHGTTLSQVENINGVFNRAARQLLLDIDPTETKINEQLGVVYQGTFNYACPVSLKGNKVIDLYWQGGRLQRDLFKQVYNQTFDIEKVANPVNQFTIFQNKGTKTIKIAYNNTSRSVLMNPASSISSNGTWVASGTASNLAQNNLITDNGGSVLSFDLLTGTGYLTNSNMSPVDLTAHLNQSGLFWDLFIPLASRLSSVSIRFGSDASNYWEKTGITTQFDGTAFVNNQNNVYALWSGMTKVGSPVVSNITYVQLGFTATNDIYGSNFAQVWSKLGFVFNIEYYSKYLFSTSLGVWQETTTDDSDIINLDTDSYNLLLNLTGLYATQQALGQDAGYDTNFFSDAYKLGLMRYKSMYKSEISKPQMSYYKRTYNGYLPMLGWDQRNN